MGTDREPFLIRTRDRGAVPLGLEVTAFTVERGREGWREVRRERREEEVRGWDAEAV